MPTLIIRRLEEDVKARLRVRAARKGLSMEEEARRILSAAVCEPDSAPTPNVADAIARIMAPLGGIDLDLPARTADTVGDPSLAWLREEGATP